MYYAGLNVPFNFSKEGFIKYFTLRESGESKMKISIGWGFNFYILRKNLHSTFQDNTNTIIYIRSECDFI